MRFLLTAIMMAAATPTAAAWTTSSDAVRAAAAEPRIAAILATMDRLDSAQLIDDGTGAIHVVPLNSNALPYSRYDRVIDFAGVRPNGEVVVMGEERLVPRMGRPNAGKEVRRRFTDVWRDAAGTWQLAVRQETIVAVDGHTSTPPGAIVPPAPAATRSTLIFADDAVRLSAADARIAAVLAAGTRAADAILAQDAAGFAADQAPELVVNSPANRVLTGPQTVDAFRAGLIHYGSSERVIEYAHVRPNGEVLLKGTEHVTPLGATRNAGKAETYRVMEVWRRDGDRWLLSLRQATIEFR